jgi:hypothetical protein
LPNNALQPIAAKTRRRLIPGVMPHEESHTVELTVTPWEERSGTCDCCGRTSKTIWGDVSAADHTLAVYYVHWTVGSADHNPNFDLILGSWGEGAGATSRILVSLEYQPRVQGGSFMVTDSEHRPANSPTLCGRALKRSDVVGTSLAKEVFELVDAVWLQDPRIKEVRALGHEA